VAEFATEVATTAGAANDTQTEVAEVATPATTAGATNVTPTVVANVATPAGATEDGCSLTPLDFDAFRTDLYGNPRNVETARRSKNRAVDTIVSAIVSVGTNKQQSLALHNALFHLTIRQVAKSASYGPDQACWHLQRDNVIKMIKEANNRQGKGGAERQREIRLHEVSNGSSRIHT
jgi:hypothetical protein